ncbi:hypothetical protein J6590_098703, partial [Homalodisca vitripennis]
KPSNTRQLKSKKIDITRDVTGVPRSTPWWLGSTLNSGRDEVSGICKPRSYHKSILATHPPDSCGVLIVVRTTLMVLIAAAYSSSWNSASTLAISRPCCLDRVYRQDLSPDNPIN